MVSLYRLLTCFFFVHLAIEIAFADDAIDQGLDQAYKLRLTGRYLEASELYRKHAEDDPVLAAIGLARCESAQGHLNDAVKVLKEASAKDANNPDLASELAFLAFERGDYEAARKQADAAIKADEKQLLARWVDAELHRVTGKLEEAEVAYLWFVRYYNGHQREITKAENLRLIGLAAAQYARWKRNSGQFSFLVNRLYPKALKLNEEYWPAYLESALLFMEKYNESDGLSELNSAMAINANSAELHAARAMLALQKFDLDTAKKSIDQALEINPNLIDAYHLRADLLMSNFRLKEAAKVLEETKKLNPVHEQTLGRLAAVYGVIDGLKSDPAKSRMGTLIASATKLNKHCGEFFFTLASTLDHLRKYPDAAKYYDEAQKRMPQLVGVRGRLGLMYMRLGDETKAAKLLDESFEIDPFNVRVKNMLAVLDVLKNYAVIETEHFVIKFDRGQDELLAQYASRYLEDEVYPELVEKLGFEPEGKSLFEIFSRSGRTSGHSWFSARMVGLPYVGTVGACAGKMVAIASPNDLSKPYNWARVLKHEFVHVVNLQQTNFNIPHWFTEALAVLNEGYPRPPSWDDVLARRSAAKKLYNLDTINFGFARPGAGDDWTLAYCQAELYAEYMVKTFGEDSLAKMLKAYADNLSTGDAIQHCFSKSKEEFEAGYAKFVQQIVEKISLGESAKTRSFAELQKAVADDPKNAESQAELAYAFLQRRDNPEARKHAIAAREIDEKHQLAAYVLARLQLSIGDVKQAVKLLEESLDEENPQQNALSLLAGLRLRAGKAEEAIRLYELGMKKFPHASQWLKLLARVHLKTGDNERLRGLLVKLVELDSADTNMRKKLAQIAMASEDFQAGQHWANQVVQINVKDAEAHALLGQALVGLKKHKMAITEFEAALQLDGDHNEWRLALAKSCVGAEDKAKAIQVLNELLELAPDDAEAKKLLETLQP